jgi:hypothetical protein
LGDLTHEYETSSYLAKFLKNFHDGVIDVLANGVYQDTYLV